MAQNIALGSHVKYVSSKGHVKLALVLATSDTLTEGTSFAEQFPLNADQVNLIAYSPSGTQRRHLQVPSQASVQGNPDFAGGGFFLPLDAEYVAAPKVIEVPDDAAALFEDATDLDALDIEG
jgi:hypothetical protein